MRAPKHEQPRICKEAVKMIAQLMVEDIWNNLDNYAL